MFGGSCLASYHLFEEEKSSLFVFSLVCGMCVIYHCLFALPLDVIGRLCSVIEALPGPEVIKRFSCSTQLSMKFVLLINLKLLTNANSFLRNKAEHENFSANKYENANFCWHFHIY